VLKKIETTSEQEIEKALKLMVNSVQMISRETNIQKMFT